MPERRIPPILLFGALFLRGHISSALAKREANSLVSRVVTCSIQSTPFATRLHICLRGMRTGAVFPT